MSALEVSGLSKAYGGVQAVRNVSFTVEPSEVVALIGPNGAGKTTCFNLLNGQLVPDAGEILVGKASVAGLPPHRIARHPAGAPRADRLPAPPPPQDVADSALHPWVARARRHTPPAARTWRRCMPILARGPYSRIRSRAQELRHTVS